MAYQNNPETYIIDNTDVDMNQPVVEKEMTSVSLNNSRKEYEIVEEEVVNPSDKIIQEIHETAVKEGLVDEEEGLIGGENATADEVIDALINKPMSEGAKKGKEEYEEKQIKKHKKVIATRDLLTGLAQKKFTIEVSTVLDVKQPDGTVKPELCDVQLVAKRLTESQSNHIFNKQMIGKKLSDMTREELDEENHTRSKYLAATVIEPKMDAQTWYEEVPEAFLYAAYEKVTEVLNNVNDTSLFQ